METRTEELKRYVRFTDEDAGLLRAFAPKVSGHFRRIAQEFYERIREHEAAHAVFTGEAQIRRLQDSMVLWLQRVFGGVYDDAYFAKTEQVGRVHVKVGLPQHYMFTAMALIRSSLTEVIDAEGQGAAALGDAVSRLLDLELAVMLESYREDLVQRVERVAQQRVQTNERRMARTEEHYARAIELAALLVIGLDSEGKIALYNQGAERFTGYARDEVLGRSFVDLLVPEGDRPAALLESRGDTPVDAPLLTRAGRLLEVRWRVVRAQPAEHEVGDIATFLVGADITQEQADQEQQQREKRLAAVGILAAGLAHEIRNPLNGARLHVSFLERALRKDGSPDVIEAVHVVDDEIQRLARLVTDFLDFARPRPLVSGSVDARALGERAIGLMSAGLDPAGVRIVGDFPRSELAIAGDAERLEQVLLNLLRNAIEAIGDAGSIVVRARREPRHAILEVSDDGPGFASTDAPVFEAFYSTKAKGTGLGLAIVNRVVTDHGGRIEVESKPGATTFRLILPLARREEER